MKTRVTMTEDQLWHLFVTILPRLNAWLEKANARMDVKLRERRKESLRQWAKERGIEAREEDLDMVLDVSQRLLRR